MKCNVVHLPIRQNPMSLGADKKGVKHKHSDGILQKTRTFSFAGGEIDPATIKGRSQFMK